jgi:long-subunit fatty acid transport protein
MGLLASGGVAYRFNDWLVVGASAHLLTITTGEVLNEIVSFSGTPSHITFETETRYLGSISLGVLLTPIEGLHVGLCHRSERVLNIENTSTTTVETLRVPAVTALLMEVTATFAPQQFSLGVEWEISPEWSVAADLTWSDWSEYSGPYSLLTVQPETTSGVSVQPHPRIDARDTVTPSFGVEFRPSAAWTIRGGYRYRPSPIPEQDGSTNLVDSNSHMLSMGVAFRVSRTVLLETYFQWHLLEGQSVRESDSSANPKEWEMEGAVILAGFGIRLYF